MMQGKVLADFLIVTALNDFYSENKGQETWDALCESPPRFLDGDEIWQPFEYSQPEDILELVSDRIDFLEQFIKDVTEG